MKFFLNRAACVMLVLVISSSLFLSGCSKALAPTEARPPFQGPIAKPVWSAEIATSHEPNIVNGIVYVVGKVKNQGLECLIALDGTNGKQLWMTSFAVVAPPVVTPEKLYVLGTDDFVYELDPKTGKGLGIIKRPDETWFPRAWSNGLVYGMTQKGEIVALNKDWKDKWRAHTQITDLKFFSVVNGLVYVQGSFNDTNSQQKTSADAPVVRQEHLLVYDAKLGNLRWKVEGASNGLMSRPVLSQDTVVLGFETAPNKPTITAFQAQTGDELWQVLSRGTPVSATQEAVYVTVESTDSSQNHHILDLKTGRKLWEITTHLWRPQGVALGEGIIFAQDGKNHASADEKNPTSADTWLTAIDAKSGQELWRSETKNLMVLTAPVVANGLVYVGSQPFSENHRQSEGSSGVYAFYARKTP